MGAGCGGGEADTVDPGSANPDSALTLEEAQAPVKKAPPELVAIRDEANEILDEGTEGFDARLAELEAAGIPVVVNKWASWCGPCREEIPDFQAQAIERGDEVAFLGLLSDDGPETGETFLSELPASRIPSYLDSDQEIAYDLDIARERSRPPLFIDSERRGRLHEVRPVHVTADDARRGHRGVRAVAWRQRRKDSLERRALAARRDRRRRLRRRRPLPLGLGRLAAPGRHRAVVRRARRRALRDHLLLRG